jgi:DNA-binding MarR family transcriptional regulator
VVVVPTNSERILRIIATSAHPMDDDEIAARIGVVRQAVNQVCRKLEAQGRIHRRVGPDGKLVNQIVDEPPMGQLRVAQSTPQRPADATATLILEDDVKRAVRDFLLARGLSVEVKWGRERGIDVTAHGQTERWIVEAKGEVASDQQQGNYFLGVIGELLQRMDDPSARYALALPNNRRFRGRVSRLPRLARQRLALTVLFVNADGRVTEDRP